MLWLVLAVAVAVVFLIGVVVRTARAQTAVKLVEQERSQRQLNVRPLSARAREPFIEAWTALQGRFEVEPEASIRAADRLLQNVMRERGYPTGDFGYVSEVISEADADVLANYRALHFISVKCETGSISEEEIRQAVQAASTLMDGLVGTS